ncbi:MAG TPA: Holliday junction branch migration protein RuvA [Tetrasphaera sp.]|uniref:Holliday junction branch migration protein RuvA n=1 Tax=Nostocoides sp. TaxID=1917966 RepID=UPI002BB402CB|nr:Holliday junction branch migration protein RuvA [Tetrasphaera sp.]HNQ05605.1 Holliday junction branch migration protein RuvA [Tetrasphaera sp.]
MIASITGTIEHVGLDRLVLRVGGVGLLVHTTPATAATHRAGTEASLATSLVVREDSLTLFGFGTAGEREMFETAQTVTGVGPRLALAILSVFSPVELAVAIGAGNITALTKVPGVGRKGAERLILELRDKVGMPSPADAPGLPTAGAHDRDQVVEALVGLGWTQKAAGDAVDKVAAADNAPTEVAALLRAALRELGR